MLKRKASARYRKAKIKLKTKSGGPAVGVNVEFISGGFAFAGAAKSVFSWAETSTLAAVLSSLPKTAFFQTWTCKEADLKATGEGFSRAERRVSVSNTGKKDETFSVTDDFLHIQPLTLLSLPCGRDFEAAVAVKAMVRKSHRRQRPEN